VLDEPLPLARPRTSRFRRFLLRHRPLKRLAYGLYRLPFQPLYPVFLLLRYGQTDGVCHGIRLLDLNGRKFDDPGWTALFVRLTSDALHLIERTDPRRMRVLRREIRLITNATTSPDVGGTYTAGIRECCIDFDRQFRDDGVLDPDDVDYEWYVAQIASLLIHEATHGRIEGHGVPYRKHNRLRVERACHREQERFVRRLQSENWTFDESFLSPFNPATWERQERNWVRRVLATLRQGRENGRPLTVGEGADDDPDGTDEEGFTPLLFAACWGRLTAVRRLLAAGADPNLPGANGMPPLAYAAYQGHLPVVQCLLDQGARRDDESRGQTPVEWAAQQRHTGVVRHLAERGAPLERADEDGLTVLSSAAGRGDLPMVRLLMELGARADGGAASPCLWPVPTGRRRPPPH